MIWILLIVIGLISSAVLLWPLFRRPSALAMARRERVNVQAYEDGLAEIDRQQAQTGLSDADAEALRAELGLRLLQDMPEGAAPPPQAAAHRLPQLLTWLSWLMIPAAAAAWYGQGGSWQTARQVELARSNPTLAVKDMVAGLAERPQQDPQDPAGWAMLGRSYTVLEQIEQAADAYAQANARATAPNPDWLVGEAEARAFAANRNLQGAPYALLKQALADNPQHERGLWYAGLAALQADDRTAAVAYWQQLLELPNVPEDLRAELQQQVARLKGDTVPVAPQESLAVGDPGLASSLKLRVTLADELVGDAPQGGVLFVFAREPGGPPMPLAVRRIPNPQLPLSLELSDADAMMPARTLSSVNAWELVARWSRSGTVQTAPGDLQGQLQLDASQTAVAHELRLDKRLE